MTVARAWFMCIECHDRGHPAGQHQHTAKWVWGVCGQCEQPALLMECHEYDFRRRPMTSIAMEGPAHYATIEDLTR